MNPSSKDLASQPDATTCSNAIKEAERLYGRGDWAAAREHYSVAIRVAETSANFLLKRAYCHYHLQEYYETVADTGKVLKQESDNIEALELRGKSYYALGEMESAMNHYRLGLKYDPEHKGCKEAYRVLKKVQGYTSKADSCRESKDYACEIKNYNLLLEAVGQHKTIVPSITLKLATAYLHAKQIKEAKQTAQAAIASDENNFESHLILGKIHMEAEEFDEAIFRFRKASELNQNDGSIQEELRKAEAASKQSKQKDYYKILGVGRKATQKEIKKAYREGALNWHPDKHSTASEEEREKAETKFQLIAEAYEVLSDDESRRKYDHGEDVFPNQGGGGGGHHHHPFHQNPFGFQQGGGQHFHFRFG